MLKGEALGVDVLVGNRVKHMIPEIASDWLEKRKADRLFPFSRKIS